MKTVRIATPTHLRRAILRALRSEPAHSPEALLIFEPSLLLPPLEQ